MEAGVSAMGRPSQVNGTKTPSAKEIDELYTQLLKLRDAVVAGQHPRFKLPPDVVEQLKSRSAYTDEVEDVTRAAVNNAASFTTNRQLATQVPTLPGLRSPSASDGRTQGDGGKGGRTAELNPIFLEKSDSLVRAEGQLKRQRLERDLQLQVDQRKHSPRDKDPITDAPSAIDVDGILSTALQRIRPVSGLKAVDGAHSDASSVFDENDYYSSQVQTDWSSDAGSNKGSNTAPAGFTADFERLDGAAASLRSPVVLKETSVVDSARLPESQSRAQVDVQDSDESFHPDEEEDEYSPPDAAAIDSSRLDGAGGRQEEPLSSAEDDNSEYEPGDLTTDSNGPDPPKVLGQNGTQVSPAVPVFRNQLTHIAAPQPSRVSPLATAKAPSAQLELVNGRPEIVQMPSSNKRNRVQSRQSTASPSGNNAHLSRRKKHKKRKREMEPASRTKKQRKQQPAAAGSPGQQNRRVKHEPLTPLQHTIPHSQYLPESQYHPAENDLRSPYHGQSVQYGHVSVAPETSYDSMPRLQPSIVRSGSAASYQPARRDTQDLRRVASLHHAQRPLSPVHPEYSPVAPYRPESTIYRDPRTLQPHENVRYVEQLRTPSPPRLREYVGSQQPQETRTSLMPPPPPPSRIVVDQYGNKYYAAEPAPNPQYLQRGSVVPTERQPREEPAYERAPSHADALHPHGLHPNMHFESAKEPSAVVPQYRRYLTEHSAAPTDRNDVRNYSSRGYSAMPPDSGRYMELVNSPAVSAIPSYQPMGPPAAPLPREPTSTVYQQMPRSHSVRPAETRPMYGTYSRQGSVVPMPQMHQEPPQPRSVRASSVMPGSEFGGAIPPSGMYEQAPQAVRYVDQYGNEVFPHQVRQLY